MLDALDPVPSDLSELESRPLPHEGLTNGTGRLLEQLDVVAATSSRSGRRRIYVATTCGADHDACPVSASHGPREYGLFEAGEALRDRPSPPSTCARSPWSVKRRTRVESRRCVYAVASRTEVCSAPDSRTETTTERPRLGRPTVTCAGTTSGSSAR